MCVSNDTVTACVKHLQVIVKIYGQPTYLPKTMKYSRHEFHANAIYTFVSAFMKQA